MPVLVNNLQEEVAAGDDLTKFLAAAGELVLAEEGYDQDTEISLALVSDAYMRNLNRQYRGIDASTDVLSFAMREGEPAPGAGEEELILGDVVISLETALRQSVEYGQSFYREIAYLTIHGVLHLIGYDHQEEEEQRLMREKEKILMARFKFPG